MIFWQVFENIGMVTGAVAGDRHHPAADELRRQLDGERDARHRAAREHLDAAAHVLKQGRPPDELVVTVAFIRRLGAVGDETESPAPRAAGRRMRCVTASPVCPSTFVTRCAIARMTKASANVSTMAIATAMPRGYVASSDISTITVAMLPRPRQQGGSRAARWRCLPSRRPLAVPLHWCAVFDGCARSMSKAVSNSRIPPATRNAASVTPNHLKMRAPKNAKKMRSKRSGHGTRGGPSTAPSAARRVPSWR